MSGTVNSDEEDNMDQMILVVMAIVALCLWTSVAPRRTAVAMRRQAGLHRSRVK
jgi:hypothetical protein